MDMAARRKGWLDISDITEDEFEAHMAQEKARKDGARYLAVVNDHLGTSDWMLGEEFSLVDCCYGSMFNALSLAGDEMAAYPAIRRYLADIQTRKAWKACQFRS